MHVSHAENMVCLVLIPVTSELLFELYNVPSVTYGIDSLFAFSRQKQENGLAVGMGHNATTVIPVVGGRGVLSRAKRWVTPPPNVVDVG